MSPVHDPNIYRKDAEALQKPIKKRHPASKTPGDRESSRHLPHLCPCILSFPWPFGEPKRQPHDWETAGGGRGGRSFPQPSRGHIHPHAPRGLLLTPGTSCLELMRKSPAWNGTFRQEGEGDRWVAEGG